MITILIYIVCVYVLYFIICSSVCVVTMSSVSAAPPRNLHIKWGDPIDYNYLIPVVYMQALHCIPNEEFYKHVFVLTDSPDISTVECSDGLNVKGLRDYPPAVYLLPTQGGDYLVFWVGEIYCVGWKLDMSLPTIEERLMAKIKDVGDVTLHAYEQGKLPPWRRSELDPRFHRMAVVVEAEEDSDAHNTGPRRKARRGRRR